MGLLISKASEWGFGFPNKPLWLVAVPHSLQSKARLQSCTLAEVIGVPRVDFVEFMELQVLVWRIVKNPKPPNPEGLGSFGFKAWSEDFKL